ncbi:MAG TPA: hypothetical protein VFE61_19325 [Candidatus Sulfotelmatobacter sp.]|jgi:hypothetical protein|nr:hypothetical protein [Candidatus Sulfotelmatobacter sp.]
MAAEMRAHGDDSLANVVESSPSSHYMGMTGFLIWSAPDLLTTYTAQFPRSPYPQFPRSPYLKKMKKHPVSEPPVPIVVKVTRESCERARE